jgi:hypothetical protein
MFADVPLPYTVCFDWASLGWPAGPMVVLAVMASLISLSIVLIRRRVHKGWVLLLCLVLFLVADFVVYVIGSNLPRPPRPRPPVNRESSRLTRISAAIGGFSGGCRRKNSFLDERLAQEDTIGMVDFQHVDCRSANRRKTRETRPVPTKMTMPLLAARIK